ncbi:unnamed protein product [Arctia plantaginis]|uniref:Uncharacterized protein n=1 Tax=Arctia plantaginis TaxID=874455 RepID=A0A8S0Z1L7_ARCPL|nr:unnamed protein product [Arctia plantaginis]
MWWRGIAKQAMQPPSPPFTPLAVAAAPPGAHRGEQQSRPYNTLYYPVDSSQHNSFCESRQLACAGW